MPRPTTADLAIAARDAGRHHPYMAGLTRQSATGLAELLRRELPDMSEADAAAVLLHAGAFLAHTPSTLRDRTRKEGQSFHLVPEYTAAVVSFAGEQLHTHAYLEATSTRRPVAAPAVDDAQAPADTAADRLQAWLNFSQQNRPGYDHMADISYGGAPVCDADLAAVLEDRRQMRKLLGVGVDREQWDAIAEAEGRRYEGEQIDDTIVGYLAYSREDMRSQRHVLLDEIQALKGELATVTAERDRERQTAAGLRTLAEQARAVADEWSRAAEVLYAAQHADTMAISIEDKRGRHRTGSESISAGANGTQLLTWWGDIDQMRVTAGAQSGAPVHMALGMLGLDQYRSEQTGPQVRVTMTDARARQLIGCVQAVLDARDEKAAS